MATQLMKLRNVPADELDEIHALLESHGVEVYETSAGSWGISMPALWLIDDDRLNEARALLDTYAAERQQRVRSEYAALKAAGKARTLLDIAKENPLRFLLSLALIGAAAWFSTAPFWQLYGG